jgi:hypothetical protein
MIEDHGDGVGSSCGRPNKKRTMEVDGSVMAGKTSRRRGCSRNQTRGGIMWCLAAGGNLKGDRVFEVTFLAPKLSLLFHKEFKLY